MNYNIDVRPGSAQAYLDNSPNLYVRERLDSEGNHYYKVSTVKSYWSYVKHFFRSLFTCCTSTSTAYSYGLEACKIINVNSNLKEGVTPPPISTLVTAQGQKNKPKTVIQIPDWCSTAAAVTSVIFKELGLVTDVYPRLFFNFDFRTLKALRCVSKACYIWTVELKCKILQHKAEEIAFGKARWEALGLDIGEEPSIPSSLVNSLEEPDHVNPNQSVWDTHMFGLIPAGLTPKSFGELVKCRFPPSFTGFHDNLPSCQDIFDSLTKPNETSYWVLMKKDGILKSEGTCQAEYDHEVYEFANKAKANYVIPTALEAAVGIFMHEFKLGEGRERLPEDNPWIDTMTEDMLDYAGIFVEGIDSHGLYLKCIPYMDSNTNRGIATLRRS